MQTSRILRGIVNASTITQSELKILSYLEKYNIPATFHFYHEPLYGGISMLMHIDSDLIELPPNFDTDPALKTIMIGLAIVANIDSHLLKMMNYVKLITNNGVFIYDTTLIADELRNSTNYFDKIKYGKQCLSSVQNLSYFTHGSQINSQNKKPIPVNSGFPIFDYDSKYIINKKIKETVKIFVENNISSINIKTVSNMSSLKRLYTIINSIIKELGKKNIMINNIFYSYVKDYDIIEIFMIENI